MIQYRWNGSMQRVFVCDACGREIDDLADVRLLREVGALPEEPSCYVHADCAKPFIAKRRGRWEPFLLSSSTAAWCI